jgi:hypothetical protein
MGNNTLVVIDTNLRSGLAIWLGVDECRGKTEREAHLSGRKFKPLCITATEEGP